MRNIYERKAVGENLYMLTECTTPNGPGVNMYLVIGTEKALLFDSGFGVVDTLRQEVECITSRPVVCIVGHGHPDHAGAASLFDEVYMNERDQGLLGVSLSYERRMDDVFGRGEVDQELYDYAKEHIVDPGGKAYRYKNIDAGEVVDIGGTKFEVFAIPGHTQGSIALLNREENYALISDAVGARTALVNLPPEKRVGLTAYRDGLKTFIDAIDEETVLWYGHSRDPLPQEVLRDMEKACSEVLDGDTQNDTVSVSHFAKRQAAQGKKMTEHQSGSITLVYDANLL